jgi:2-succinyl-5-enolpyruvyl-6-hydroxy-3-cyclohexene-1-carboxylate synthase
MVNPKFDVDLYVSADLRALTSVWMGHSSFAQEFAREQIVLIGDKALARSLPRWLQRSSFAASRPGATASPPSVRLAGE